MNAVSSRIIHKTVAVEAGEVGDRQVRVVISTPAVDRAGEIVVQSGLDLTAYRACPVVLWQHDPKEPIARCIDLAVSDTETVATVEFAPEGVSPMADKIYGLVKSGVVNAASVGFAAIETELMPGGDKKKGPFKYLKSELMEFSFVSIPANRGAVILERAAKEQSVMNNVKGKPIVKALIARLGGGTTTKGLYEVGRLASLLESLGWLEESVEWEAEWENDGSLVPAALAAALAALGRVLIDMTIEEVTEMIGAETAEVEAAAVDADVAKAFRAGYAATMKAGKAISKSNADKLREACKSILAGHDVIVGLIGDGEAEDNAEEAEDDPETEDKAQSAPVRRRLHEVEVLKLAHP